jgi:DNA-binding phage protein
MALTRKFKDTVQARVQNDPEFRRELFSEALNCLMSGELDTGRAILRDYINATIGFEKLAEDIHKPSKSIHRMFGPAGNPQAKNLFEVIAFLKQREGASIEVHFAQ